MHSWRVINTDYGDGFYNMALDETLMLSVMQGHSPPILRFYRWNPPTITLGYAQDLEKEVLTQVCDEKGIQVVRRLTGGRAILHQHELTYSLIANEKEKQVSGTILESYLKISKALAEGLNIFGVQTEMAARPSKDKGSAACFDAPSWYEIVWQGRKLIGSAQTRKRGFILQHGSIPFKIDIDLLFNILNIKSEQLRDRLKNNFGNKAIGLEDITGKTISADDLVDALIKGFENVFSVKMEMSILSADEIATAENLRKAKYSQNSWNYNRGKNFKGEL